MRKSRFLFENPPINAKWRVFSLQVPHLSENHAFSLRKSPIYLENHAFSLRKSPIYAKNTRFLFANPTFMWKTHVFSSQTSFNPKMAHFQFANPPFKRKSHVFSSRNLHSTRKSLVLHFANPPLKQKSRVFPTQIPYLCENHAFYLLKFPI